MSEEGRKSKVPMLFVAVAAVATIIVFAILFTRMVKNNPLEGEWINAEKQLYVTFDEDSIHLIGTQDEGDDIDLSFSYTMDKEAKIVYLKLQQGSQEELLLITDRIFSDYNMEGSLKTMDTQFEYSVQGNQLTLMERDFGDTLVLNRQ